MLNELKKADQENLKKAFRDLLSYTIHKKTTFEDNVEEKQDYYIATEENRAGNHYIHLIPKEIYHKFRGNQIRTPNKEPLQHILCKRIGNKNVKAALFGIDIKDVIEDVTTSGK